MQGSCDRANQVRITFADRRDRTAGDLRNLLQDRYVALHFPFVSLVVGITLIPVHLLALSASINTSDARFRSKPRALSTLLTPSTNSFNSIEEFFKDRLDLFAELPNTTFRQKRRYKGIVEMQ